jgi:hypothetical protein
VRVGSMTCRTLCDKLTQGHAVNDLGVDSIVMLRAVDDAVRSFGRADSGGYIRFSR